jgi:hypothetical protein
MLTPIDIDRFKEDSLGFSNSGTGHAETAVTDVMGREHIKPVIDRQGLEAQLSPICTTFYTCHCMQRSTH